MHQPIFTLNFLVYHPHPYYRVAAHNYGGRRGAMVVLRADLEEGGGGAVLLVMTVDGLGFLGRGRSG